MKKSHVLLVVTSLVLALGIYFLPVKPLKQKAAEANEQETEEDDVQTFESELYFSEKRASAEQSVLDSIVILESVWESSVDSNEIAIALEELVSFCYRSKVPFIAAEYEIKRIEQSADVEVLKTIGDRLVRLSFLENTNPGASLFFGNASVRAYSKALEAVPEDIDLKVRLASTYLDGTNQVMSGVSLLLEVLETEPNNIDANLILGRYGIVSGQLEKALSRLNTVIEQDSSIAEAYLYRAEALNGLGRNDEAIEDFERCKSLLDNPQLAEEIDIFIKELKNK